VKIRAPAKINLSLRVVGRRADGYHLLDTVIVPVSLYDEIELRKARRPSERQFKFNDELIQVRCDHPSVPQDRTNLVYRAAALIMKKHRKAQPVWIRIRKNIPVGAGLGGGSSDAAATLIGLNRLLNLRLSTNQLEKMALVLGADVPFFIRSKPARARGIWREAAAAPRPAIFLVCHRLSGISRLDRLGLSKVGRKVDKKYRKY
jgi:4-diphosphocytidyl-2-C-methyl-D-erythritol kinase